MRPKLCEVRDAILRTGNAEIQYGGENFQALADAEDAPESGGTTAHSS